MNIVNETDMNGSSASGLQEKKYSVDYLNNSQDLRQQLIRGAKRYSENLFHEYIRDTITANPVAAQHKDAGKPGLKYQVRI